MKYWLQTQAPAGNWTDYLGSHDEQTCVQHGEYLINDTDYVGSVRVVKRTDTEIWKLMGKDT